MKLRISKGKLILLVLLFSVSLGGGIYLLLLKEDLLHRGRDQVALYSVLSEYCEIKKSDDSNIFDCYAFLGNDYTVESGNRCLEILLVGEEGQREEVEFCDDNDKIVWENPYPDYSLHIPVVFELDFKRTIFRNYRVETVVLEVMEDEKAKELLDLTNTPYAKDLILIQTLEEYRIQEQDYRIFRTEAGERVLFNTVLFRGYGVEEGKIRMYVGAVLHGLSVDLVISSKKFILARTISTDSPGEIQEVEIDVESADALSDLTEGEVCKMSFSFEMEESKLSSYLEEVAHTSEEMVELEGLDLIFIVCNSGEDNEE